MVTARQIGSADRPAKQTVAREDRPRVVFDEHYVAGRMAWRVPDLEFQIPNIKYFAMFRSKTLVILGPHN